MKHLSVLMFSVTAIFASELIHISNSSDIATLMELSKRYKKELIVSKESVYVVPSQCLLERHFGGLSQNYEVIEKKVQNSAGYEMTQALFEANNEKNIAEEVQRKKISDEIEGRVAKAFLDDNSGHLFGGISQSPIDLSHQRKVVEKKQDRQNPTCRILDNATGYIIEGAEEIKLFMNNELTDIKDNTLFFE